MDEFTRLTTWLQAKSPGECALPATSREWESFATLVLECGMAGLVLETARRHQLACPSEAECRLSAEAKRSAAVTLGMMKELSGILSAFNEAGIAVMLLKGAALHLTVYSDAGLRPMSDVDLLVRPDQADAACRLLGTLGCRRGMDLVRPDFFPRYYYEVEYLRALPRPLRIDLHVRPFRPLRLARTVPEDALWCDAVQVPCGAATALVPNPEVMFIHLAAHAAYHGCSRLMWLYDIKRLVDAHDGRLDWARIAELAGQWKLAAAVLAAAERTEARFGPTVPDELAGALAIQGSSWRDRLTLWQTPRDASSPLMHVMTNWLCTPGLRFATGYVLAHLTPGAAHLAEIYPYRHRGWRVCAHLWRVLRAIGRGAQAPIRALFRRADHSRADLPRTGPIPL